MGVCQTMNENESGRTASFELDFEKCEKYYIDLQECSLRWGKYRCGKVEFNVKKYLFVVWIETPTQYVHCPSLCFYIEKYLKLFGFYNVKVCS